MTPKEKAKELFDKYIPLTLRLVEEVDWVEDTDSAKQCALIAVNEIIKALRKDLPEIGLGKGYWYSVRKEIQKL
jgi:hypothetical protein